MPAAAADLHLERDAGAAVVSGGDRLDARFTAALADICREIGEDDDVRVLLLAPAPQVWAGWDGDAVEPGDPFAPLAALPQPSIAAISGDCLDGGLELALCADLRVAAPGARFGLPGAIADSFPVAGGLQRLARAIGRSRAGQLALAGNLLGADQALAWGLITAVADDPGAEARRLAGAIAQRGPIALRYAKDALQRGSEMPLAHGLQYETELTILLQATADRAEGVAAFAEKREPAFRGA